MENITNIYALDVKELYDFKSTFVDEDTRISEGAFFKDDEWPMHEYIALPTASEHSKTLRFLQIMEGNAIDPMVYPGFIIPFKEYSYARMFDANEHDAPASPLTIQNQIGLYKVFVLWCSSQRILNIRDVTKDDLDEYVRFVSNHIKSDGSKYSPERICSIIGVLPLIYFYSEKTTYNFSFQPFRNKSLNKIAGKKSGNGENKTEVIPDSLYKPLMKEAYNYVVNYSEDLMNIADLIEETEAVTYKKKKHLTHSGASKAFGNARKSILENYNYKCADTPQLETFADYKREITSLKTASNIISIGLSGMRISEFYSLVVGCLDDERTEDKTSGRIYLNGTVYKGNGSKPKSERWVVDETVKKAIEILEYFSSYYFDFTDMRNLILMSKSDGSKHMLNLKGKGGTTTEAYKDRIKLPVTATILFRINEFANHIPEITNDGECDFNFNTRHFRRTLAHHIAKEPFGIIAGMLQYKHVETEIFEGYAGHDISFLELINKERALSTIDYMEEIIIDAEDGQLAGAKGDEILEMYSGAAGDRKGKDVGYYLQNSRMNIYPGLLNYCFFDPDVALCLKDTKSKDMPILNACHPDVCKNGCVGKKHVPVWKGQIDDAKNMSKQKYVNKIQKKILTEHIKSLEKVIAPFKKKGGGYA